ncbi:glycine-rich domain-containing protein [Streptomyces sp. NPDC026206]|uniref:glycine-rich domain-containing protein n=1 Tax=Streptomyces sp. NPDC026206 TaxID=3157089 RepID=UPI0033D1D2DA
MRLIPSSVSRCAVVVSAVMAASLLSPSTASAAEVQMFGSPGEYTFTVPEGVSQVHVAAVGGGGGGGGGGGNNNGTLSGGAGGGGGSGAVASCDIEVRPGETFTIMVGSGGAGGGGGSGRRGNGASGEEGDDSVVFISRYPGPRALVNAAGGDQGSGGQGSGSFSSGYGGSGGAGGAVTRSWRRGDRRNVKPGKAGHRGDNGYRNDPGQAGFGAPTSEICPGHGGGGNGRRGAGNFSGVEPEPRQESSLPGDAGDNGCAVLTYTPNASSP